MSLDLHPGDLCVIVRPLFLPEWNDLVSQFVGHTVVLLGHVEQPFMADSLKPYWRCSGMPYGCAVSHTVLRKIPPDQMLDARMHDEPVHEPGDGPTVTVHPAGEDVLV